MQRTRELRNDWTEEELEDLLSQHKAIAVPVSISIRGKQKVLSFADVESIVRRAELISLENCWCREKLGNCDAPLDVCLTFDDEAKVAMTERGGREVTADVAMAALERSHRAGLVHLAFARKGYDIFSVCGCCSCCCHTMAAITRFGYDLGVVEKSSQIAVHDPEACTDCVVCVTKCHFGAWGVVGNEVRHYPMRCAGCGVCVTFCPTGAITLRPRAEGSGKEWTRVNGTWVLADKGPPSSHKSVRSGRRPREPAKKTKRRAL